MAYIQEDDFESYSPNTTIDADLFAELAERASDIIDRLTLDRIPLAGGLSALTETVQAAVKKATCAQLQTMAAQGGLSTVEGFGAEANQGFVSLGRFAIGTTNTKGGEQVKTIDGIPISPLVYGYLRFTNLTYRGL